MMTKSCAKALQQAVIPSPRRGCLPRGVWRMNPWPLGSFQTKLCGEGVHSMSFRRESFSRRAEWRNPKRFAEDGAPSSVHALDPSASSSPADSARGDKTIRRFANRGFHSNDVVGLPVCEKLLPTKTSMPSCYGNVGAPGDVIPKRWLNSFGLKKGSADEESPGLFHAPRCRTPAQETPAKAGIQAKGALGMSIGWGLLILPSFPRKREPTPRIRWI